MLTEIRASFDELATFCQLAWRGDRRRGRVGASPPLPVRVPQASSDQHRAAQRSGRLNRKAR